MWRQTLAHGILYLLSAEYSSNVWRLAGNISDLTVALSQYDILFCLRLRYVSCAGVAGSQFWSPYLVVAGQDALGRKMMAYI